MKKSKSSLRAALLVALLATSAAQAQTIYQWNGTTNGTFATTTNWTSNLVMPFNSTSNSRLNVNNTDITRPLTYSATQGTTIYSGGIGRSLVIASGSNGNMVITGGTFDSRQTTDDIMVNGAFAGSLTINGGSYINTNGGSEIFQVGFNGGGTVGAVATLNVESGNFTSGRVQFGQNAGIGAGGLVGVVNLNGGILSTKQFSEQASLTTNGLTGSTAITSTVNFNGGTLRALETGTIMKVNAVDNAVVQANGAIIDTNTFNTTIDKALTAGTGSGGLTKQGAGTLTLSAANTYTGGTTLNQGTVTVGTGGTLGASTGALSVNNTNSTAAGTNAILNLATAVDTTAGSLSGTIATPTSGTNTATINITTGRTLTVNQTADATYAGVIAGTDGNFTLGSLSTHKLTLAGANTYTGVTTVEEGTLLVSGSISGSVVNVNSGGTLGGAGTINNAASNKAVTLAAGGKLSAGVGVGAGDLKITTGTAQLNISTGVAALATEALVFELDTVGASDKVTMATGFLNIGTGVLEFDDFDFSNLGGLTIGTYTLFDTTNTIVGTLGTTLTGSLGGIFSGTLSFADSNRDLVLLVVPEPNVAVTLLGGVAMLLGLRRRRRA